MSHIQISRHYRALNCYNYVAAGLHGTKKYKIPGAFKTLDIYTLISCFSSSKSISKHSSQHPAPPPLHNSGTPIDPFPARDFKSKVLDGHTCAQHCSTL